MTRREFLNAIVAANVSDEITEYASAELARQDAANEKRRNTPSKTQLANEPIKAQILEALAAGTMTASEIGATLEISTAKASALARALVADGKVTAEEVKGKSGMIKAYSLA